MSGSAFVQLFEDASRTVPGVAGAVLAGDLTVAAAGLADLAEERRCLSSTLFRGYSISKPLTALGVLKLSAYEGFPLDAPVNQYLTSLRIEFDDGTPAPVTARHLLTHTAGVPSNFNDATRRVPRFSELMNGRVTCLGPPGERWEYSNGGYGVLQELIEDVTGMRFHAYMNEIVSSIGITDGRFSDEPITGEGVATPYDRAQDGSWNVSPDLMPAVMAAGGLWVSANDFARLVTALQESNEPWLVSAMREATQPHADTTFDDLRQGLGWMLRTFGDEVYAWHSGASLGGYAELWLGMELAFGFCANASVDLGELSAKLIAQAAAHAE